MVSRGEFLYYDVLSRCRVFSASQELNNKCVAFEEHVRSLQWILPSHLEAVFDPNNEVGTMVWDIVKGR